MKTTLRAPSALSEATDVLAIGLTENAPRALPEGVPAELAQVLHDDAFEPKLGATLAVRTLGQLEARWILFVGLGDGGLSGARVGAGAAGNFARDKGLARLALHVGPLDEARAAAVVEGVAEGNYRYEPYLPEASRKAALSELAVLSDDAEGVQAGLARGRVIAKARAVTRDLVNAPPADLYPETLADAALRIADERVTVEVWDEHRVRAEGMVGITAVGQGSERGARFIHMTYTPEVEPVAEVALVGKGVTFDAGGYSMKTSSGMQTMRCDMGGAGAVIGAFSALAELGLPVKVHGLIGAVENLVSGGAFKLGDILRYRNGVSVEIHNTDAEGRLVLADCLINASRIPGVTHVVDLATLTGAAVIAVGPHYTAMYANDEQLAADLLAAAGESGEGFWRLPLEPLYKEMLKGDWGQIKNVGGRAAGSITAALFLQHFVDGKKWSHLDIAGPAFLDQPERHFVKGAAGAGTAALLYWLSSLAAG